MTKKSLFCLRQDARILAFLWTSTSSKDSKGIFWGTAIMELWSLLTLDWQNTRLKRCMTSSTTTPRLNKVSLAQNKLLDRGASRVAKIIRDCRDIIHLDVSSNGITPIGFSDIFMSLYRNNTIISLNLSSSDRCHRNKLGTKGAKDLADLLKVSWYLQYLNLSSTGLCNEGAKMIFDSLKGNQYLVSLIIKSNEMTHSIADDLTTMIIESSLEYLDISHNNIGNLGILKFWSVLQYTKCLLKILKLVEWGITSVSSYQLYSAVKYNNSLTSIYLDYNNLSGRNVTELRNLLWTNNRLKVLSLCHWSLGEAGSVSIAEGFVRNNSLTHLYLRDNHISDKVGRQIINGLSYDRSVSLEVLDLSYNMLKTQAGEALLELLPRLKNPPSKIWLAYNLLETHKHKILQIFTTQNISSDDFEKYQNEK